MWLSIRVLFNKATLEIIDPVMNRIGLGSIATALGIEVAKVKEVIPEVVEGTWVLADYALALSIVGSVLFIIDKIMVIYLNMKAQYEKKTIELACYENKKIKKIKK